MICRIPEMFKQIAVWLSIATLMPLVVWYGTDAMSGSPDNDAYSKASRDIQERMMDQQKADGPTETTDKSKELRAERDKLEDDHTAAMKLFARHMFWIAYPLGMVAFVVGLLVRVQAVGSGLMFGGVATLTTGCYSYWDQMDSWLKFGSLLIALAVTIGLGLWRFRNLGLHEWTAAGVVKR